MDGILDEIIRVLQKQLGHHRRLLECLRAEKDALESFQVRTIQERTLEKESILREIQDCERVRARLVVEWSVARGKPEPALTLSAMVERLQTVDLARTEQLTSLRNALNVLFQRLTQINEENRFLVENGLKHIQEMKRNALGVTAAPASGYTQHGTRAMSGQASEGRLIVEEA